MSRIPLTKEGEILIKEKLSNLKFVERPQISQAIAEARAHGDLKENAEYHAAKELQGLVEAKINEMENALANAQVIDVTEIPETGRVGPCFRFTIPQWNGVTPSGQIMPLSSWFASINAPINRDTPIPWLPICTGTLLPSAS